MGSTATTKTTRSHHQLAALLTSRVPPELRPAALTAIRVYALGWSVTTVPGTLAIVIKALITAIKKHSSLQRVVKKAFLRDLPRQLRSSVLQNGLPYLLAGAFAGHHFLAYAMQHHLLKPRKDKADKIAATTDEDSNGGDSKKKTKIDARVVMFLSSAITMIAVRRAFPRSKTLDFTFFALVRALDVIAHRVYSSPVARRYLPNWSLEYGSVIVFTLACMEIMFAWFFAPERLPRSYSMWITKMSEMDERLLFALRAIREGKWIYGKDTGIQDLLGGLCEDLGLPKEMGDPVNGRIPCLVVHQGQPYGCEVHSMTRFIRGFIKVFPLYFAVHFTPRLLFRTSSLVKNPTTQLLHTLKATMRSSAFLASFIAIIWYAICLTRTRIGHQLLGVDQSRLDNTLAPFIGCALCGLSLLIESKHRRGEMALYVVPRALYSLTERVLGPYQRGRWWEPLAAETAETLVFASSITVVLDAMFKDQSTVRSSVRGLLSWILKDELKATKQEQNGKTA